MMKKILSVENINTFYGAIQALRNVSLEVRQGEIVSLIGANGAGKTTLLKSIMRQLPLQSGSIVFLEKNVTGMTTAKIVRNGMTMVPEGRRVFPRLSVMDNISLGGYCSDSKEEVKNLEKVFQLFPKLYERRKQTAGTLSGGEQQMLAMARALMSKPKVLLLDEPSMGLAPIIVKQIFKIIMEINREGTTILLVEQNANMALKIAHRGYVMETGSIVLEGTGKELISDERVKAAYLGD